jgi:hypothetical protein
MPPIAGDNVDDVASPEDYSTWVYSDSYWDPDNDTSAENVKYPMLLPSPPPITDREDKPNGETQSSHSSGSDGSTLWALGTSALIFGLIDFGADKLDFGMEDDKEQDGGDDHKNPPIIQPLDGYGSDVEHGIEKELYHPTLLAYSEKMGDLDIVLERLDELDEEKTELQREKETRQQFGFDLDPNDEAWLLEYDAIRYELDEKRNAYEAQAALLKQECLLRGWIDDEGELLPAALGWKTEDIPTPNSKDLEKALSQWMLILTGPQY